MRSYFLESNWADAKTGSLVREIADFDYIVVDNEREALALENNLIKQYQPKFNMLLRDDKTYPYIRFTAFEKYPRVYVHGGCAKTARSISGRFFRTAWRYRIVHFIHKTFSRAVVHGGPDAQPSAALPRSITFSAAVGPCVPGLVHRRTSMRKPRAIRARFWKAAATT